MYIITNITILYNKMSYGHKIESNSFPFQGYNKTTRLFLDALRCSWEKSMQVGL